MYKGLIPLHKLKTNTGVGITSKAIPQFTTNHSTLYDCNATWTRRQVARSQSGGRKNLKLIEILSVNAYKEDNREANAWQSWTD